MLNVNTVFVTSLEQNCRIVSCTETKLTAVVDPGGEVDRIDDELQKFGLDCSQIWLTHSHFDHCGCVQSLKRRYPAAKLYAHPLEAYFRAHASQIAEMFGVPASSVEDCPEPDVFLNGGETITLGASVIQTIHSPGHSAGSICYSYPAGRFVIVGDVLFAGAVGRTDLPGGSSSALRASIQHLFDSLAPETKVLCGHGRDTTLKVEQATNPYLR